MSILKDKEIKEYVKKNLLIAVNYSEKNLTPNGYDLSVSPSNAVKLENANLNIVKVLTYEYLKIPADIVATMYLKSRYSRQGAWGSFGFIDAGFEGCLEFTLFNMPENLFTQGDAPIPIVQVIFEKLDGNVEQTYEKRSGHYHKLGETSLTFSPVEF